MKVLIAPMAAIAETSGPFSRAKTLAIGLLQKGSKLCGKYLHDPIPTRETWWG
jgi:hypothetical protein